MSATKTFFWSPLMWFKSSLIFYLRWVTLSLFTSHIHVNKVLIHSLSGIRKNSNSAEEQLFDAVLCLCETEFIFTNVVPKLWKEGLYDYLIERQEKINSTINFKLDMAHCGAVYGQQRFVRTLWLKMHVRRTVRTTINLLVPPTRAKVLQNRFSILWEHRRIRSTGNSRGRFILRPVE